MTPRVAPVAMTHFDDGLIEKLLQVSGESTIFNKLISQIGLSASLRMAHASFVISCSQQAFNIIASNPMVMTTFDYEDNTFFMAGTFEQWKYYVLEILKPNNHEDILHVGKAIVSYFQNSGYYLWSDRTRKNTSNGYFYFT